MADYTTVQGDTWDIVSRKNYGSEKYVDVLIEANPDHRLVFIFGAGVLLQIPALTTTETQQRNLPPWKRQ